MKNFWGTHSIIQLYFYPNKEGENLILFVVNHKKFFFCVVPSVNSLVLIEYDGRIMNFSDKILCMHRLLMRVAVFRGEMGRL